MVVEKYQSLNFVNFDELLTEEQLGIRETVRKFVDDEVILRKLFIRSVKRIAVQSSTLSSL